MSEKLREKQIKTYKDIIIENSDNKKIYEIDEAREKELLKSKEVLRENVKLLFKVLGAFVALGLLYLLVTRVIFKIKKDPVYFSNTFSEKVQSDTKNILEITNKEKQIKIDYLEKYLDSISVSNSALTNLFLIEKNKDEESNIKTSDFLLNINKIFLLENIDAFGSDFSLASLRNDDQISYFAFLEIDNFNVANKYMILWENRVLEKIANNGNLKGFLSKKISNKKVRVMLDKDKKTVFGYSFVDQKVLVFFSDEKAFKNVVKRIDINKK